MTRTQVNLYLNAADCLLLYSSSEGSPQLIKEAMACNCPVVSTDVGDVKWVIGETNGCYITSFETGDVAGKLIDALEFTRSLGRTNGRNRITALGLDSRSVALKLMEVYSKLSHKK
jgi:glycosyltransferase involved in cell wall biosynthesis